LSGGYEDITIIKDYGNPDLSLKLQGYKDILSQKEPIPKNPQNLGIYNKIIEVSETMERSMEISLFPVENVYEYSVIGAPDPTFRTDHFLRWAENKNLLSAHLEKFRKKDSESSSCFGNCLPTPDPDQSEIISSALTKGWKPEKGLLKRASQEDELAIWNKWIKPIVDLHYNGTIEYIYFKEPQKLSYDEVEKVWELSVAPFLCSCKLTGIKIPASMSPTEAEDRIMNYIWEPNLFLSEILFPLKAGRGADYVDPFLKCLINILDGKDLPAFLAYIAQGDKEGLESKSQQTSVENPSNKPLDETKPTGQLTEELSSPDNLISNITIRYENDSQITIQKKGKQSIPVSFEQLRFREPGLTWKNFLNVLQSPPNYYWLCPKDSDRQQIRTVNKRLIEWIEKNMGLILPPKYNLHERAKSEAPGTYRFKFKVDYSDTIQEDESSKTAFRNKFFNRIERYKRNPHEYKMKEIHEMASTGFIKKFLTEDEVRESLENKSRFNPKLEFKEDPETSPEIESEEDEIDFSEN
jgi:hypothetical protein